MFTVMGFGGHLRHKGVVDDVAAPLVDRCSPSIHIENPIEHL